jgi:CHASE3 domain sensor protein
MKTKQMISSSKRINNTISMLGNDRIHNIARLNEKAFTRNRQMTIQDILMINLARKGKTLSMEINNYFKDAAKREDRVSKQAFSKQRMNLNPEVFVILNNEYIQSIYK